MMHGKIDAAVKMLSNWSTGIHSVDDKVLKELQNKRSDPSPVKEGTLLNGLINQVLPSYFDSIDKAMVLKAASLTNGAGKTSQLDFGQIYNLSKVRGPFHNWTNWTISTYSE